MLIYIKWAVADIAWFSRLRGYQHHTSGPGEPRQNPRAFGKLDDAAQKFAEAQSSVATPDTGAEGLEQHGFAERQSSP